MKFIISVLLFSLISFNAFAIQLICNSPEKDPSSGKSMMVYRYNSEQGTMERFTYNAERGEYLFFGALENLVFTDDLYNMSPLKRVVSASLDNATVLTATWSNGNVDFRAKINGERLTFLCKSK